MPAPTSVFTSLGFKYKKAGGGDWGEGAALPPKAECKHLFSHVIAVSFQEKISNVILRDVNAVQNTSYMKMSRIYRCGSLGLDKKRVGGIGGRAQRFPPKEECKHLFSHVSLSAFQRRLVRKNASCGRWSWLAFTPSC